MNDAAVQGFGAIHGRGVELVITLNFALPDHVTRIPNEDGLLGGVMPWKEQ